MQYPLICKNSRINLNHEIRSPQTDTHTKMRVYGTAPFKNTNKKRGCPRDILAGVGGVEPPITESKSVALPLGYTPIIENESSPANRMNLCKKMGRVVGVEPTHNGATIRRVNHFTTPAASCHTAPAV